jgi:acyl carrier protein
MSDIKRQKFKDLTNWPEMREALENANTDPKAVAEIGEQEIDSLGQVELVLTLEEALAVKQKPPKS